MDSGSEDSDTSTSPLIITEVSNLYPCHPDRIGVFEALQKEVKDVSKLVEQQVADLEEKQQKPFEELFSDPKLLTTRGSQWFGFTPAGLNQRKLFFKGVLLSTAKHTQEVLELALKKFSARWVSDKRYWFSPKGKANLEKLRIIWQDINKALRKTRSKGPFRPGTEGPCREALVKLDQILEGIWVADKDRCAERIIRAWVELDGTKLQPPNRSPSRSPPRQNIVQPNNNEVQQRVIRNSSETVVEKDDQPVKDLESQSNILPQQSQWTLTRNLRRTGTYLFKPVQTKLFLRGEVVAFLVSLAVSIFYSAYMKDPQTGFTIGGYILAGSTLLLLGISSLSSSSSSSKGHSEEDSNLKKRFE